MEEAFRQFQFASESSQPEMPKAMLAVIVPQVPSATNELVLNTRKAWAASIRLALCAKSSAPDVCGSVMSLLFFSATTG